jgi:hypothetical protein
VYDLTISDVGQNWVEEIIGRIITRTRLKNLEKLVREDEKRLRSLHIPNVYIGFYLKGKYEKREQIIKGEYKSKAAEGTILFLCGLFFAYAFLMMGIFGLWYGYLVFSILAVPLIAYIVKIGFLDPRKVRNDQYIEKIVLTTENIVKTFDSWFRKLLATKDISDEETNDFVNYLNFGILKESATIEKIVRSQCVEKPVSEITDLFMNHILKAH